MNKLEDNGYVKITLDNLPDICADLLRLDDVWQDWGFTQLVEALRTNVIQKYLLLMIKT